MKESKRSVGAWALGGFLCLAFGAWLGTRAAWPDRIVFLSVGQGDCAVLQSEGRTVLIDDGPVENGQDAGDRIILPKLRQLGVEQVDLILLSHSDTDHVGGTGALLRAFPRAQVGMSAEFREEPAMRHHLTEWGLGVDQVRWLGPQEIGRVGRLAWRIVCPSMAESRDANTGSMFVRVGSGVSFVDLTGDAPQSVETKIGLGGDWQAIVLKAGHHGSRTATGAVWLREVHPKWVVVSCGRNNRYGHPNEETLARIRQAGAQIARTDAEGDIEFDWDGDRLVRR